MMRSRDGPEPGGGNALKVFFSRLFILSGLLLAICLLSARTVFTSASPPTNPHAYFRQPGQCPRCHLYSGSNLEPGRFAVSSVDFCLECHLVEERGITHPLKVRPGDRFRGIIVPKEYRLSHDGRIICLTCHTAHGPGWSIAGPQALEPPDGSAALPNGPPPGGKTYFLRRSDPGASGFEGLCGGCHKAP